VEELRKLVGSTDSTSGASGGEEIQGVVSGHVDGRLRATGYSYGPQRLWC
jgi:hypothetical protein